MATAQAPATGMALTRQKVSAILTSGEAKAQIAPFLSPGVSLERVVSTINQVVAENPEILECTPASIILAVGKGVKQDLEFGETAHLVPFNHKVSKKGEKPERWEKRAKMLRDWKGDIELVKASGAARDLDAQCFYKNEHFVYHQGTNPYIEHHPIVDATERGPMVGAYAWALISQRQPLKIMAMSVAEIDKIRQEKSKSWKEGPLPDWYARKTLIHQITKALPKNRNLAPVLSAFDKEDLEIPDGEFEVVETEVAAGANAEEPVRATASPEVATASAAPSTPEPQPSSGKRRVPDDRLPTEEQVARLLELAANEAVDSEIKERVETRLAECTIDTQTAKLWIGLLEEKVSQSAASQELFAPASAR